MVISHSHTLQLAPMWMAPNVLTLSGWSLLLVNLGLLSFYDWDYGTTGNAHREPIPSWVWLCCGIFHFLSHTLDGIDGKQARRTGATSPLGNYSYNRGGGGGRLFSFDVVVGSLISVVTPLLSISAENSAYAPHLRVVPRPMAHQF